MKVHLLPIILAICMLSPIIHAQDAEVDPAVIARRCIAHVRELTERCVEYNAQHCRECLRRVNALLEAGNERRARVVATECIEDINQSARECVQAIRQHSRRCIAVIEAAGGSEDLIQAVKDACERAVQRVLASRQRCVNAIHAAFEPEDPE